MIYDCVPLSLVFLKKLAKCFHNSYISYIILDILFSKYLKILNILLKNHSIRDIGMPKGKYQSLFSQVFHFFCRNKDNVTFLFPLLFGTSKRFYKCCERRVKVKIYVNVYWSSGIGTLKFELFFISCC